MVFTQKRISLPFYFSFTALHPVCGGRHEVLTYFLLSQIILANGGEWTEELEIDQYHSFELDVE